MRYTILIISCLVAFAACKSNDSKEKNPHKNVSIVPEENSVDSTTFTTIEWLDSLKDFGSVNQGQKVDIVFRFRNTGDKPLYVQGATAGCGCTVPEYTQEAVMPGKEGFVKAVFNSINQPPTVQKTITVTTNTKNGRSHDLHFIGEVKSN